MKKTQDPKPLIKESIIAIFSVIIGITLPNILQLFFSIPKLEMTLSEILVIILLTLLAGACLYLLTLAEKRTADVQAQVTEMASHFKTELANVMANIDNFEYEQDFEHDWTKGKYEGRVFRKLTQLVTDAKFSIDAISLSSIADKNFFTEALNDRINYFEEIVRQVELHHEKSTSFIYRRVFQVGDLRQFVPQFMLDHRDSAEKLSYNTVKCYVKYTSILRMTGLVIIDHKILVFVINGITGEKGEYYPVALLIFKKGAYSKLIESYTDYFNEIFNRAVPMPTSNSRQTL